MLWALEVSWAPNAFGRGELFRPRPYVVRALLLSVLIIRLQARVVPPNSTQAFHDTGVLSPSSLLTSRRAAGQDPRTYAMETPICGTTVWTHRRSRLRGTATRIATPSVPFHRLRVPSARSSLHLARSPSADSGKQPTAHAQDLDANPRRARAAGSWSQTQATCETNQRILHRPFSAGG